MDSRREREREKRQRRDREKRERIERNGFEKSDVRLLKMYSAPAL